MLYNQGVLLFNRYANTSDFAMQQDIDLYTLMKTIQFHTVRPSEYELVANWLELPDVKPYWSDDGFTLKDLNDFFNGESIFSHWFAMNGSVPLGYLMSSILTDDDNEYRQYVTHDQRVRSLDILIADESIKGLGIAHFLIRKFLLTRCMDAKEVFIDPSTANTRAIRVYEKAGFQKIADFMPESGPFKGIPHVLMSHQLSLDSLDYVARLEDQHKKS